MSSKLFRDKKFYLILAWLLFTSIFAAWWMKLGLGYVDSLSELLPAQKEHWDNQRRMLLWEGLSWIALLFFGGFALIYFMARELSHFEKLKTFFASFNHDVKTSLASLRLQAESLKEDMQQGEVRGVILDRLISDTMRLQVQLENSLYLGANTSSQVWVENLWLSSFIKSAQMRWPQIQIHLNHDASVQADQRALTTIFNNLIQNSLVHGASTEIHFVTKTTESGQVEVGFYDNGRGFSGSRENLGKLFFRPTSQSGSGIGLYICHELLRKMNGRLLLNASDRGFSGAFVLDGNA